MTAGEADRRRPGRPSIGDGNGAAVFTVKFPKDLLDQVDRAAADKDVSRAEWLRRVAAARTLCPEHGPSCSTPTRCIARRALTVLRRVGEKNNDAEVLALVSSLEGHFGFD